MSPDHHDEKPVYPSLPVCGRRFDDRHCTQTGEHLCEPRAAQAVAFCQEICVHTKDKWARRPFILADWQRDEIVAPLLGRVTWSSEHECYVRQCRVGWIELARKSGKSQLLAFLALYLLVGDGVYGAEVYGCARDRNQAAKVWDVAEKMIPSPRCCRND